ncbi:MAG: hypothetical protein QOF47_382 [Mycobacterium sp.]|nr:hypothetical protein [Mycobacterium sp.]
MENHEKLFVIARIAINIVSMLGVLRRLLGFRVTIGELMVVALAVSYLGSIVSWPVLLVADVCMT